MLTELVARLAQVRQQQGDRPLGRLFAQGVRIGRQERFQLAEAFGIHPPGAATMPRFD
jgi:hypothetical protein